VSVAPGVPGRRFWGDDPAADGYPSPVTKAAPAMDSGQSADHNEGDHAYDDPA
jgi:hypothetical protein